MEVPHVVGGGRAVGDPSASHMSNFLHPVIRQHFWEEGRMSAPLVCGARCYLLDRLPLARAHRRSCPQSVHHVLEDFHTLVGRDERRFACTLQR
jgi:hypothetical protein